MEDTMENVDTVHAGPEESGKTKKEKKPHGVIFWGFLFLICVIVATIASSGTAALFELGMYESKDAFRRNVNEYLMDGYAVQALSDHKGDFQFEEFENSNFQYAVLESDDIENEDLTDKDTYLVCSLDEEDLKHARHLYCYSATVSDDTQFSYSTESLFDSYGYVSTNRNPDVSVKKDETKNYYLYATVRSPLDETQDDLFTRSKPYVDLACKLCLLPVLLAMIGWIATCVCFVFGFLAFVRLIKRIWKFVSEQCRDNVPLLWRLIAVFAVCALVSFFFTVVAINLPPLVFCVWLLHIGVVGCLFVFAALQLNRIKKGADRLVEGTFDTPVNTKGMFFDFKSIAESINKASDGMEAAIDDRMKSEHFKTELISNVSHDIKTPLTSIISYVELLKEQPENEPANREYLETLDRQSMRLKKLLEDLIEASKATTGNLPVELENCSINMVLNQILGEYAEKLSAQKIDLRIRMPQEELTIPADTKHLQRVLDNLLTNIAKYAQPGTRAYANLDKIGDEAVIELKNTSQEALNLTADELMERFVQGDTSRNTEGHGLGLNIAQSLMEVMGGKMELCVDGDLFKAILRFPIVSGE